MSRAPAPAPVRRRARDQRGVTIVEILVVVAIVAIIGVPLTSWAISTLRQQEAAQRILSNAVGTGVLAASFSRDVASASQVFVGTGGDCVGGPGSGAVRLAIVSGGMAPTRVVYTEAASSEGGPGAGPSLWRRQCAPDGTLSEASELFEDVVPGSVTSTCDAPGAPGAACRPTNRKVTLELTPARPVASRAIELHAGLRTSGGGGPLPGGGNRPPIAQIDATPLVGFAGTAFSFSAAASTDPDGDPLTDASFRWELPDGSGGTDVRTGTTITHTFDKVGEYTVLLRVDDGRDGTNVAATTVRVINQYPTAAATVSPEVGAPGDTFTFDAGASVDPDGSALTYEWDFGAPIGTKTGRVVTETFAGMPSNPRQVMLTVTDAHGGSDTHVLTVDLRGASGDITITPTPVVVPGRSPRVGSVGPGMPPLEVTFEQSEPGAGITWALSRVGGAAPVATSVDAAFAHTFGPTDAGEYQIVRQRGGVPVGSPVTFRVNAAPTADFTFTAAAAGGVTELRGTGPGGSTDDGSVVSYRWDLGFFGRWTSTNPDPSHVFTNPGTYRVTLSVTDDDGATAEVVKDVTIIGTPDAPPPPRWVGDTLRWDPVPGAAGYRIVLTCDSVPFVPDGAAPAVESPGYTTPAAFCPGGAAAARLRVSANGVDSIPSAAVIRP